MMFEKLRMIRLWPRWRVAISLFAAIGVGMAQSPTADDPEAAETESPVEVAGETEQTGTPESEENPESEDESGSEDESESENKPESEAKRGGQANPGSDGKSDSSGSPESQAASAENPELTAEDLVDGPLARTGRLSDLSPLEKARYYAKGESFNLAEKAYLELVDGGGGESVVQPALMELAEVYYAQEKYVKAVDTLDKSLKVFPNLAGDPENIYRLGEFYRAAGLHEKALSEFYRVINMVIMQGSEKMETYFSVARMAQFQIARANYESGNFEEAFEAFERIEVLELTRENREVVLYYGILSALKAGQVKAGETMIKDFSREFGNSEFLPELIYLRAEVLMKMGKTEEATEELVKILETFEANSFSGSAELIFWKQQAGNRLANRYYAEGDYAVALRIYQGMVGLDDSPDWQLPVIYQMGLCFEKLSRPERAQESYTYLLEDLEQMDEAQLNRSLRQLGESATWRLRVLEWRQTAESDASALLNQGEGST